MSGRPIPRRSLTASLAWIVPMMPGRTPRTPLLHSSAPGPAGRFGVKAAIAGPPHGVEYRNLALESEDAAVDVGFSQEDTGIVDEVAGGKVVGAVDDEVIVAQDRQRILGIEMDAMRLHPDVGIDRGNTLPRRVQLGAPDVGSAMKDLTLEVREVDRVEVHESQSADPGRSQVERGGRAKPSHADQEHAGALSFSCPSRPTSGMIK